MSSPSSIAGRAARPARSSPVPAALLLLLARIALAEDEAVFIMVAGRDLAAGDVVETSDLYAVDIPPDFVPDGVVRTPSHAVGRVVRAPIFQHEFVVDARLGAASERALPLGSHVVVLPDSVGWKRPPGEVVDLVRRSTGCTVARKCAPTLPFWPALVVPPEHLAASLAAIHDDDVDVVASPSPAPDCPPPPSPTADG